jgi:hypothetical protein
MNRTSYLSIGTLLFLALAGCGGSSAGKSGASLNLSRNKAEVAYGDPVTISWSSKGLDRINVDDTNFVVTSDQLSGSFTDTPALDTDYTIVGDPTSGSNITRTVSVKVTKSTKKIVLVADTAISGVPQIQDYIQGLTTPTVVTSLALPSLTGVDVLVILESASIGPAQQTAIKNYLNAGGSVVLVGRATNKLATGDFLDNDISSIGSWFAGATEAHYQGSGGFAIFDIVASRPAGIPLSAIVLGDGLFFEGSRVLPVSSQATVFDTDSSEHIAFTYKPISGGKVGFCGAAPIGGGRTDTSVRTLFLSIVRWAADGV